MKWIQESWKNWFMTLKNGEFRWMGHSTSWWLVDGRRVYTKDIHFIFQISMLLFLANLCIVATKGSNLYNGFFFFFFGKLALSYHILRKISLNFSYLEYRFEVLGNSQTKLGLRVAVHLPMTIKKMSWFCENYVPFDWKYWMTLHATWIEYKFNCLNSTMLPN